MSNKLKGSLCMIASALAFAFMQAFIALTSGEIPLFEQLLFRNLFASGMSFYTIYKLKICPWGKKENRKLLSLRAFFGFLGMIAMFYASGNGSQGDVAILNKMSPFFVTILAVVYLKEKINKYQIISLFVAFSGAFIVCNPEMNTNIMPLVAAFICAVFSGVAYTCVGALKGRENPAVTIFFFSFTSTIVTIPLAAADFVIPSFTNLIYLCLIGVSAALGQLYLTYAYTYSSASEVSIYNYSGIIFSMILGLIFFGQGIAMNSFIGAVLVIVAGLIVFFGNKVEATIVSSTP